MGPEITRVLTWYFAKVYGAQEGPGAVPFYCDPSRVGAFAVSRDELAAGSDIGLFRLFVAMSMFQALRDVVIMRQQRNLAVTEVRTVARLGTVERAIANNDCPMLASAGAFEAGCNVRRNGQHLDCGLRPGSSCHVKDASRTFNRMGDMGKLPTSAWLRLWRGGGIRTIVDQTIRQEHVSTRRAALLVERLAVVHRVGRKIATMFVSALSTPALAPGLTPWFPEVDGNELVVVDTNVAQAVDSLRPGSAVRTYDARERWIRRQAARIDLQMFHPDVPRYSPRIVQQALYTYCSRSNRRARGDECAREPRACRTCVFALCPFHERGGAGARR